MEALIASALSQQVSDLVLTYTNAKDIWDKLVSVYEQTSVQRLNLLMTDFFNLQRESEIDVAAYVAKVEKLFADMNTDLRRRGSYDIPVELLHGRILASIGPEYQEFSNVWESLNDNKRTTNSLIEKLCTIEKRLMSSNSVAESGAFAAQSFSKPVKKLYQSNETHGKSTENKKNDKPGSKATYRCFHCGAAGHVRKYCRKLNESKKNDNPSSSKDNKSTAFSATSGKGHSDAWICDSGASHHMTANKQYFVSFKKFTVSVNVQVAS